MTSTHMNPVLLRTSTIQMVLKNRVVEDQSIDDIIRTKFDAVGSPRTDAKSEADISPTKPSKTMAFRSRLKAVVDGVDNSTSAIDALVADLSELANGHPEEFYSALAKKVRGYSRNHVARTKAEVYPERPDFIARSVRKLAEGWWLGTNIANREKMKILEDACRLRGVQAVVRRWTVYDFQSKSAKPDKDL